MKYYIATALSRAEDHNIVRDAMARFGHELTYDWTSHGSVKGEGLARLREVAAAEARGVLLADWVVVLVPGGRGTHAELGMGIGYGKRILVQSCSGHEFDPNSLTCAFYHHPLVEQAVCSLLFVPHAIARSTRLDDGGGGA